MNAPDAAATRRFNPSAARPLIERAEQARKAGNWGEAEACAAELRSQFPEAAAGWRIGFGVLRAAGRHNDAAMLLDAAAEQFAGAEWLLAAGAALALEQADWPRAANCAASLREAFPQNQDGYRIGLRSLRLAKQRGQATVLLAQSAALWPAQPWLLIETAALMQAQGDFAAAAAAWQHVRAVLPNDKAGYSGGFRCYLAARQLAPAASLHQLAEQIFVLAPWLLVQRAELAYAQGALPAAAGYWQDVRQTYPGNKEGYHGGYRTARKLGDLGGADAILDAALQNSANDRWALKEAALLADAMFDFEAVDERWSRAATAFPDDQEIRLRHALARAQDRKLEKRDWPITLSRLGALNVRFPLFVEGWAAHIKALRFSGALDAAEELAENCLRQLPQEPALHLEYALTAGAGTDVSLARLAAAAPRFAHHAGLQHEYIKALIHAGQLDQAEQTCRGALDQFPESAELACEYAEIAGRRADWPAALQRWRAVRAKSPSDRRAAAGLLDVQAAFAETDRAPEVAITEPEDQQTLFADFESLGGTGQGCEFGLVQRSGGAEPLGLLRWAQIRPEDLLTGLVSAFRGVGTPEQTLIDFYIGEDPQNPEYRYNDKRLNIRMHTFVRKKDVPMQKMAEQTCLRMRFLRRKLIQDLEEGNKIFVYKIHERDLSDAELSALRLAMTRYGQNTLLYVRYADATHPSGTVISAGPGLLIGFISGFNIEPVTQKLRSPDLLAWTDICRAALALERPSQRPP